MIFVVWVLFGKIIGYFVSLFNRLMSFKRPLTRNKLQFSSKCSSIGFSLYNLLLLFTWFLLRSCWISSLKYSELAHMTLAWTGMTRWPWHCSRRSHKRPSFCWLYKCFNKKLLFLKKHKKRLIWTFHDNGTTVNLLVLCRFEWNERMVFLFRRGRQ